MIPASLTSWTVLGLELVAARATTARTTTRRGNHVLLKNRFTEFRLPQLAAIS